MPDDPTSSAPPPIRLVTTGYKPVPESELACAEQLIAELREGKLTGFVMIAVGPEISSARVGYSGGRMDRLLLLGALSMAERLLQDRELGS